MTDRWEARAACADVPFETFFPEINVDDAQRAVAEIYCVPCPVRVECLEDALANPSTGSYGVRGGLSEHQRRALKRQRSGAWRREAA